MRPAALAPFAFAALLGAFSISALAEDAVSNAEKLASSDNSQDTTQDDALASDDKQKTDEVPASGSDDKALQARDICLANSVREAPPGTSVEKLKSWCEDSNMSGTERNREALRARYALEEFTQYNPFVMTPHRRNYILPYSYWDNPKWNDPERDDAAPVDYNEAKFQISIKVPIADDILGGSTLYGAFTMVSFWQLYNADASKPFRETNYEPEIFLSQPVNWQFGPIDSELLALGIVHQSNGQDVPVSRSWNRLFLTYIFRSGSYYYSLKPWWRIPEKEKKSPLERNGDDNPDIEDYLGHFELSVARPFSNHVAEILLRNNFKGDNKGAVQLDYTFPLSNRFKGIFQAFTGYGDSLINYNDYENRFSIGILLTDTL